MSNPPTPPESVPPERGQIRGKAGLAFVTCGAALGAGLLHYRLVRISRRILRASRLRTQSQYCHSALAAQRRGNGFDNQALFRDGHLRICLCSAERTPRHIRSFSAEHARTGIHRRSGFACTRDVERRRAAAFTIGQCARSSKTCSGPFSITLF